MSTRSAVSTAMLAGALTTALAAMASAAPMTEDAGQAGDGCRHGEVLRRRARRAERLRRRPGHHLPGHLDGRLPGQRLEVRRRRHLRHDGAAGRPHGLAGAARPATSPRRGYCREGQPEMHQDNRDRSPHAGGSPLPGTPRGRPGRHELQARAPCRDPRRSRRTGGFFEVHAENYMGAGGPPHAALARIREEHAVSLHGVCMSIGGPQPLDRDHLRRFAALVERYEPALVSEHLAWSTHATTFFNDLLPLPYTAATLAHVSDHIAEVQDAIRRPILLENPSTYVVFPEFDARRDRVPARGGPAQRLRPPARRGERIRLRHQPRLRRARLPGGLSARTCRRDPSRRPQGAGGRRRRAAADRQPRRAGARPGLGALRERHCRGRAGADAGRMGQRGSGLAGAEGGSRPRRRRSSTATCRPAGVHALR